MTRGSARGVTVGTRRLTGGRGGARASVSGLSPWHTHTRPLRLSSESVVRRYKDRHQAADGARCALGQCC